MIGLILSSLICFVLLALLAFANCAETAFTSANAAWIREQAEKGDKRAKTALYFMENPENFLLTSLLNANVWNVSLVTVFQVAIASWITTSEAFRRFITALGGSSTDSWDELITSVIVTAVGLIFAEILPKAIARTHGNRLALVFAGPLKLSEQIFRFVMPVGVIMESSRRIIRYLGVSSKRKQVITRDDLRILAETMEEQGVVKGDVGDMLQSALDMNEKPVTSIMVPLVNIQSVQIGAPISEVERLSSLTGFQWLPVYRNRIDEVLGVIGLHVITEKLGGLPTAEQAKESVERFMIRDILFVPDTMTLKGLHDAFRSRNRAPAFVINEFGGILGLVTYEDLVLSVAGWVNNTRDKERFSDVDRIAPNVFDCDARIDVREIEDELDCDIEAEDFTTGAGLVMKLAGRMPVPGDEFRTEDFVVRVLDADRQHIKRLRFVAIDFGKKKK